MQDFIVKGKGIFIGLEDSKSTWKICVRCEGMIIHQTSMPADYSVLRNYLFKNYPDCRIQSMYEAGFGGFWLHDNLTVDGITCVVTPPNKVTQEKVNKVKTDRVDARRLALNLENGDYKSCHVPDRERREDRQLSRTLCQIQSKITSTKNQIRKFLDFHGLNEGLPAGPWNSSQYKKLKDMSLSPTLKICMDTYLHLLHELQRMELELKRQLKVISRKDRYRESVERKRSCPGVAFLSAIRFTLEWGDLSRFESGKRFASFTGLTCSEYSTGETVHKGRITGQGSGRVRRWLIQCAWTAIRHDPVLLKKFQTVWRNSGSRKKAIVAVARKLAVRMRAMEISDQYYTVAVVE
jgi:transposase